MICCLNEGDDDGVDDHDDDGGGHDDDDGYGDLGRQTIALFPDKTEIFVGAF